MSGGGKSQVVGYRYYFGIHMGIGRGPIDALHEVRVGDRTAWAGNVTENSTINIDAYNLFGGEEKEGGVQGPLEVMLGGEDQVPSAGLSAMLGSPLSGFRRMFTVFYDGLVSMNNPYPKAWKFRFGRILRGWDGPVFEPDLARIPLRVENSVDAFIVTPLVTDTASTTPIFSDFDETASTDGLGLGDAYVFDDGALRLLPLGLPTKTVVVLYRTPGDLEFNPAYSSGSLNITLVQVIAGAEEPWLGIPGGGPAATILDCNFTFYDSLSAQQLRCSFRWTWWDGLYQLVAYSLSNIAGTSTEVHTPLGVEIPTGVYSLKFNNLTKQVEYLVGGVSVYTVSYPEDTSSVRSVGTRFENSFQNSGLRLTNHRVESVTPRPDVSIYSMNPAHIIFECLTNRQWGRGLDRSKIDADSFAVAALQLFNETFGLCIKWTRKDSIASFVQMVLNHIGATLYQSRLTGLMTLKLIRNDYSIDDLPVYTTENGLLEVKPSGIGNSASAVNAITVKWHDPFSDEDRTVSVKNTAAILRANGAVNSASSDYQGIPTAELALRVAQRDLRVTSTNLRRFSIVANRLLEHLHPGDVFAIKDDSRGVPLTVVRIGKAKYGTLENGQITFDVVQDVFALPAQSFVAPAPNNYTPPDNRPCIGSQHAFEVPYFMLARRMSPADFAFRKDDGGYFATVVAKGKPINAGYKIAVRNGAPTIEDNPPDSSYVCAP